MTNPLFVADLDTLKLRLRLSDISSKNDDALAILDEGILNARIAFWSRLGEERVGELVAITYNENPGTEDEILRALANTTEVKLVWCFLLERLPHAWMDSSGDLDRRWNEEAPFRETSATDLEEKLERCRAEIAEAMDLLSGDDDLGDACRIKTLIVSPKKCPPKPGDSLRRPTRRRYRG